MPAVATSEQHQLQPDWDELRTLHVKGLSLKEISDRFGIPYVTVRSRSSREKWATSVANARSHVIQAATNQIKTSCASWINKLDQVIHAGIDNVLSKDLRKIGAKDLVIALDAAERCARMARPHYGLDNDNEKPRTLVQVNVHTATAPTISGLDAIDVVSKSIDKSNANTVN